jgi:hypothetical protein
MTEMLTSGVIDDKFIFGFLLHSGLIAALLITVLCENANLSKRIRRRNTPTGCIHGITGPGFQTPVL